MANFSDRLKELRAAKGVSQQELADYLNIHKMTVSGYERGLRHPSFGILDDMAEYLDASLDYLLGTSDVNRHYPKQGPALIDVELIKKSDPLPRLTAYASLIAQAYDKASPEIQQAVRRILDVKETPDADS